MAGLDPADGAAIILAPDLTSPSGGQIAYTGTDTNASVSAGGYVGWGTTACWLSLGSAATNADLPWPANIPITFNVESSTTLHVIQVSAAGTFYYAKVR